MRACRRLVAAAPLLFATAALAPPIKAEPERIHVQFDAPKGCSDEATFLRALKKRTKSLDRTSESNATRSFVVSIRRASASASGQLEIRGPGVATSVRTVAGETCDEVAAALALMTALALDPGARDRSTRPENAPDGVTPKGISEGSEEARNASSTPGSTGGAAPVAPRESPTAHHPSTLDRQAPEPEASTESAAAARATGGRPLRWSAGGQIHAGDRVSPAVAWGGTLFVEAALSGAMVSPAVRGGLFFSQASGAVPSGAEADFHWYLAFLEGCPTSLTTADGQLAISPCLAVHAGALRGQGRNLDQSETTAHMWADLGPVIRARAGLGGGLSVEAQGAIVFPLRRLSFDVQDAGPGTAATTVFAVPSWGVRAGIGVAYDFR